MGHLLPEEQARRLERVGMVWDDAQMQSFARGGGALECYRNENGDTDVPENDFCLGRWVSTIRLKMKNPQSSNLVLSKERIRQMDEIGIEWI